MRNIFFSSASAKSLKKTKYQYQNSWSVVTLFMNCSSALLSSMANSKSVSYVESQYCLPSPWPNDFSIGKTHHERSRGPSRPHTNPHSLLWWQRVNPFNDLLRRYRPSSSRTHQAFSPSNIVLDASDTNTSTSLIPYHLGIFPETGWLVVECKGVGLMSLVSCSCSVAVVLSALVLRSAWLVPCSSFLAACSFWTTVSGEKRRQGMGWITRLGWSLSFLLSWIGVFLHIALLIVGFV